MEEDSNGFPARLWHELSFDCFLYDQANGPARPAFGRVTTDHGDDALLFRRVQQRFRARAILFIKRALQTSLLVAVSDGSDRFRRQLLQRSRRLRRAGSVSKVQQRQSAQRNSNRLDTAAE